MQLLLLWLLSIFSLINPKPDLKPFHISGYAQGTTYQLTYYSADSIVMKGDIEHILARVDSSLSIYKSYSLINRFNDAQKGMEADLYLRTVVLKSLEISRITNGAFDITVKPLVQAWGFGAKRVSALPDSNTIKSLLSCVGSDKIHLYKNQLVKDKPCVEIDVNGIAQGYTVDLLANFLERKGILSKRKKKNLSFDRSSFWIPNRK
jgi:thiamine biosynthesis lipoprotein